MKNIIMGSSKICRERVNVPTSEKSKIQKFELRQYGLITLQL